MNPTAKHWLKKAVAAFITGVSTSGLSVLGIAAGDTVGLNVPNLTPKQFVIILISGGAVGLFAYLKTAPVPPDTEAEKTPLPVNKP